MTLSSARRTSWGFWRWRRWPGATNSVTSPERRRGSTDETRREADRVPRRLPVLSDFRSRRASIPARRFHSRAVATRGLERQIVGAGLLEDSWLEGRCPRG